MGCCGSKRNQQPDGTGTLPIEDRFDNPGAHAIEYEPDNKPRGAGAPLSAEEKLRVSERKHRPIFNLPPHERLINVFRCQKIGANSQTGKLYLWEAHVCFKSQLETHVIRVDDVLMLKVVNEHSTLVLNTRNDQFFFSFDQAPVVYDMLMEWREHQPKQYDDVASMRDPTAPRDYGAMDQYNNGGTRHVESMMEDPTVADADHTATVNLISRNPR